MTLASIEYLGDLGPQVESYIINHNLHECAFFQLECRDSKNSNSSFLNVLIRDRFFFGKLDNILSKAG